MIISGLQSPVVRSIANRMKNFVVLLVARNVLQTVFREALKKLNIPAGNGWQNRTGSFHGSYAPGGS